MSGTFPVKGTVGLFRKVIFLLVEYTVRLEKEEEGKAVGSYVYLYLIKMGPCFKDII